MKKNMSGMYMYCGGKTLPKNKQFGSEENCKRQVRLYGHIQVANPVYSSLKLSGKAPVYCGAKKTSRKHGTVEQCKQSKQLRRYGLFTLQQSIPSKPKSTQISRKTQKNKAANKIGAIFKGQKEKKKFVQLMKNVNAAQQRRRKSLKKILYKEGENQFTGKNILKPDNLVSRMQIVSDGDTGSGAIVAVLETKDHGTMACKLTRYYKPAKGDRKVEDPGWHEVKMYNLLNHLVNDNVTPFILKNVLFRFGMHRKDLHPSVRFRFEPPMATHYHALLTESVEGKNMKTLHDFLYKEQGVATLQNIVFQVLWTLECFNRIGVRHNDLHPGNIFVFKHKRSYFKYYRIFKYKDEKGKQHVLYVPATDYEVRIFDFDRSAKRPMSSQKLKNKYKPGITFNYTDLFMKRHTLSNKNPQFDTFKFMQHVGSYNRRLVFDGPKFKSHLDDTAMEAVKEKYKFNSRGFLHYFLAVTTDGKDPQIKGYPTTVYLIQQISKLLNFYEKPAQGRLIEIYDMDNIYKNMKPTQVVD